MRCSAACWTNRVCPLLLRRAAAAVWWLFLLIFGVFPISLSGDLYYLFVGVVAPNAQYWLYLVLVPLACQTPDFFWRQVRR